MWNRVTRARTTRSTGTSPALALGPRIPLLKHVLSGASASAAGLGVSAGGDLFACHRFVDDIAGALGSLAAGVDRTRQAAWLSERHVSRQSPCGGCWARYLCGGGCHHETISRERRACDYIRGWLHYCLGAYARLAAARPALWEDDRPAAA